MDVHWYYNLVNTLIRLHKWSPFYSSSHGNQIMFVYTNIAGGYVRRRPAGYEKHTALTVSIVVEGIR